MYQDEANWNAVEGEEKAGFLDQINPIGGKHKVSPQTTQVHWRSLPFYNGLAMIRVVDSLWPNKKLRIYYLTEQGNLYRLNGTSPPIHEVNAKGFINVTEENVLEYLRFFCFFVRGEEGPFLISEDINDPLLPEMDQATRNAFENVLRPASYEGRDEKGNFRCDAIVFYSNALFIANFSIEPTGMIQMLDDEPVLPDIPVRVDQPVD
ncbi:MAG: hypothetical protein H6855_06345 [Rhodospirillales bacterium]|nr:hypothetical protein [Rhodospirillales bacterium]MCB9965682.1 hypothetical protein [Rhodospirillales bacterium]